jgi:hypothetical protein
MSHPYTWQYNATFQFLKRHFVRSSRHFVFHFTDILTYIALRYILLKGMSLINCKYIRFIALTTTKGSNLFSGDQPCQYDTFVGRIWDSHSGGYEEFCFLGYHSVQSVESQQAFRKKMSPSYSRLKNKPTKSLLATCFMLVPCFAYSSTLKMNVTCSSETLVDFQQTTRQYIPEVRTLIHRHLGMSRKDFIACKKLVSCTDKTGAYSARSIVYVYLFIQRFAFEVITL